MDACRLPSMTSTRSQFRRLDIHGMAALLAMLLLREKLSGSQWLGGLSILLGSVWLLVAQRKTKTDLS